MGKKLVTAGLLALGALGYKPITDSYEKAKGAVNDRLQFINQEEVVRAAKNFCSDPKAGGLHDDGIKIGTLERPESESMGKLTDTDRYIASFNDIKPHTKFNVVCEPDQSISATSAVITNSLVRDTWVPTGRSAGAQMRPRQGDYRSIEIGRKTVRYDIDPHGTAAKSGNIR